jgi:hypothetical protein
MRFLRVLATLGLLVAHGQAVSAQRPADGLFQLVPPEAGATLAIEDLRHQAPRVSASPLFARLKALPAVQEWLSSPGFEHFNRTCADLEHALNRPRAELRDALFGQAVVLALHLDPAEDPAHASGLLLLRFADRALVDRFLDTINAAQRDQELLEVRERQHEGQTYHVRIFKPGTKPDEYYAFLPGSLFAWSNSETALRGIIDRAHSGGGGLAAEARFRAVRARLPKSALACLFVNPRFIARLVPADSEHKRPAGDIVGRLVARNLAAVQYVGAAIEWREGLVLHVEEAIDPSKLDAPLLRWAKRAGSSAPLVSRVPPTALVRAAGHIDLTALYDELTSLVSSSDRSRLENTLLVLKGLLMGKDPVTDVLPHIGPGAVAYLDAPDDGDAEHLLPPLVAATSLATERGQDDVAPAVDNALRTFLAMYSLDPKNQNRRLRVVTRAERGMRLTALEGSGHQLGYAIDEGLLVLSTSPSALARYLGRERAPAKDRFERFRTAFFPNAESFFFADLPALYRFADPRREAFARRWAARSKKSEDEMRAALDRLLGFINLFDGAFATTSVEPDFSAVHRTMGLVGPQAQR